MRSANTGANIKDLRRMMVDPDHQRKGIGQKLLQWGLDLADKQKMVCWLYARPAAVRLYESAGFKVMGVCEYNAHEDDEPLDVPPGLGMLREPQTQRGL
jgi:GNAT superfamily N-acetyltransferase